MAGAFGAKKIAAGLKGAADVGKVAAALAKGELPSAEESAAILKTIPGLSDMAEILESAGKIGTTAGKALGLLKKSQEPDDGKPKSCWLKSHGRGFGRPSMGKPCNPGRESSGGFCYD